MSFLPFVTAPLYFVHVLSIRESVYMQSFIEKLQRNSFSIFLFQWYMYRVKLILLHVIDIFTCMKCSIYYHVFDITLSYTKSAIANSSSKTDDFRETKKNCD